MPLEGLPRVPPYWEDLMPNQIFRNVEEPVTDNVTRDTRSKRKKLLPWAELFISATSAGAASGISMVSIPLAPFLTFVTVAIAVYSFGAAILQTIEGRDINIQHGHSRR